MIKKAVAVAAVFGALAVLERVWPLRRPTQPRGRRFAINAALAGVTGATVGLVQSRVVGWALRRVEDDRYGLLARLPLPRIVARVAGVVLLDYALWHWHRLNHAVPLLWKVHAAHHVDPDLDVSTALRFHALELLASVPLRAAQIVVLGIDRKTLQAWELATVVEVLFHHSNLRLPAAVDRTLSWFVITPRLHGIHHAVQPMRLHTNFGTLFSLWDVLHGTRDDAVAATDVVVGIPERTAAPAPGIRASLALPVRLGAQRANGHVR